MVVEKKTLSKMAAVRKALFEGVEDPSDGVAYLGELGITISKQQFSTYKSNIRRLSGKPTRPRATPVPSGKPEAPTVAKVLASPTGMVSVLASIKGHVDALGASQVIEIIKMLAK